MRSRGAGALVLCVSTLALLASGCAQDPTPAAVAGTPLNIAVELRGHPQDRSAWRPHVRARRGSVVVYRISLFNPASAPITNVRLRVKLPRGLRRIDGPRQLPALAFRSRGIALGSFEKGEAQDLSFRARYTRRAANPARTRVLLTTSVGRRTTVIPTRAAR